MTKENLRKIYLQKRQALSLGDYAIFNRKINDNFFSSVSLSKVSIVHTFLPIDKTREPDTWSIIKKIQEQYPQVKVSIPKINTQTSLLDNFFYEGSDQLETNTWGIPEPKYGVPTPPEKIDLVIVPLLVADAVGHRVGYGRGFYDKFLKTCRADVQKVGLSFFNLVQSIDDTNAYDEKMTSLVTPEEVFHF